jgi:hypothetical protein
MNEITERFFNVIDQMGLKPYTVSKDISFISQQKMTNAKKARNGVSVDMISALCSYYENINAEYIITGKGSPLKDNSPIPLSEGQTIETIDDYKEAVNRGVDLIPEVNFKFAAGQTALVNGVENVTRYWYLPDCKDCEGVAQVVGNSMSPVLPSGCWVALKKVTIPSNPLQIPFGSIFGIVVEDSETEEYRGHIKVLRRYKDPAKEGKYWIAHSINEKDFDDFDIEISQVRSLWIVKQHVVSDILL